MLHLSINAVIYYGDSLALSDPIQVSFLGANWSCQFKHVPGMSKNVVNCNSVTVELPVIIMAYTTLISCFHNKSDPSNLSMMLSHSTLKKEVNIAF